MPEIPHLNALDRAIIALAKTESAAPDFYRCLGEGTLWFFVPYHPEVDGAFELKNGMQLPFIRLKNGDVEAVAVYSSGARAEEAMETFGYDRRQYSPAEMEAQQALALLGNMELAAVLNAGCSTGSMVLPPNLLRDVASGEAFAPVASLESEEQMQGRLKLLDPADYPIAIIQPLFETLRRFPHFRAAWILGALADEDYGGKRQDYQVMILMQPRDPAIFHELNMVHTAVVTNQEVEVGLGLLEEEDEEYVASFFRSVRPFYLAPDYELPPGALGIAE